MSRRSKRQSRKAADDDQDQIVSGVSNPQLTEDHILDGTTSMFAMRAAISVAIMKLNDGAYDSITMKDIQKLARVMGEDDEGNVSTESIRELMTSALEKPCTPNQAEVVVDYIDKTITGSVTPEALYHAVRGGIIRQTLVEQNFAIRLSTTAKGGTEVSKDLLKTWTAWRNKRDDAFTTLPVALMYLLCFVGLIVSHLRIWERHQQEQAIENWVTGWSRDWGGPYLHDHVTNVPWFWYWVHESGMPCIFQDERGNQTAKAAKAKVIIAHSVVLGDVKLIVTPEDGDDKEVWLLNSPAGKNELLRLQALGEEKPYMKAAQFSVNHLKETGWAGELPPFIRLIWCTYNQDARMYAKNEVKVEFDPSGKVIPSMTTTSIFMQPYPNYGVLALVAIYGILILRGFLRESRDMCGALTKHGCKAFLNYWDFWAFVDWSIIVNGLASAALWSLCCWYMEADSLQDLMNDGFELSENVMSLTAEQLQTIFDDLNLVVRLFFMLQCVVALNVTTILGNLFKAFQSNARLSVVTDTIQAALPDIIHFMIVFMVIFVGFALIAHILFGNDLPEFQSFGMSMTTSFDVLMGAFDWFLEFMDNNALLGSGMPRVFVIIWFLSYNTFVLLVLLNMLMAVILERYAQMAAKLEGSAEAPTLWLQVARYRQRRKETKGFIPLGSLVTKMEVDENVHQEEVVTQQTLLNAFPAMGEKQAAWLMKSLEKEAKAKAPQHNLDQVGTKIQFIEGLVERISEQMHSVHTKTELLQNRVDAMSSMMSKPEPSTFTMDQAMTRFSQYTQELKKQQDATQEMRAAIKELSVATASLCNNEEKSRGSQDVETR